MDVTFVHKHSDRSFKRSSMRLVFVAFAANLPQVMRQRLKLMSKVITHFQL